MDSAVETVIHGGRAHLYLPLVIGAVVNARQLLYIDAHLRQLRQSLRGASRVACQPRKPLEQSKSQAVHLQTTGLSDWTGLCELACLSHRAHRFALPHFCQSHWR